MNTTNTTLKLILPFLSENLPQDSNIVIGCSGGADSTALAILLSAYSFYAVLPKITQLPTEISEIFLKFNSDRIIILNRISPFDLIYPKLPV